MKQLIIILFLFGSAFGSFAQTEKFKHAMQANLLAFDTSFKNPSNLVSLANNFERIALAEKNQWLPYYYASYAWVNYSFISQDKSKADQFADKAESLINKADSLEPGNSEISCIRSMIASVRLMVNPMERYMQYGPVSGAELEKAIKQDPTNPRPYLLKGQSLKFTPEQFGGGCAKAVEQLKIAKEKFETFKTGSDLSPDWGKQYNQQLLTECN